MYQGAKLGEAEQPKYEISEGMKNALYGAESPAAERELPGEGIMRDQLRGSTSSAINAIKQTGNGLGKLGAINGAYQNEQQGIQNIALKGAQRHDLNQKQLMDMQLRMGTMQDKQWNLNEYKPWQDQMAQASDMKGAGIANLFGAATDTSQAVADEEAGAVQKVVGKEIMAMLEKILKGQ